MARINTNIAALNALNALNKLNRRLDTHQLRLATGKRINAAGDDAAGLSIANKLKVRADSLGVSLNNIGDAKNMMSIAEGYLQSINDILGQMRNKATQAANDILGTAERTALKNELKQLGDEIDDQVNQALFNNIEILKTTTGAFSFQVGAGTLDSITFDLTSSEVGYTTGFTASQLDVVVGSATASVSTTYDPVGLTVAVATSPTFINSGLTELSEGFYTVEVTSVAANSAGAGTITFQVRDSAGVIISIDGDGSTGTTSDTDTSVDLAFTGLDPAVFDTGVGFTIDFSALSSATSNPTSFGIDYAPDGGSVATNANAAAYIQNVDDAIENVSKALSFIGAVTNRLTFKEDALAVARTNTEAAKSRILDADIAFEQLEATKLQILQQTATAMLAQANAAPQAVLALFQ